MPNSIDFRADQIQTKQIIVTGSGAGTTKLLIYGIEAQGSPVNEGLINQTVFPSDTTIGSDVFLYVSGALNTKGSATVRGTSVFGGDLVVSGSLYNGSVPAAGNRGIYSHAEGLSTLASGAYSHAEGRETSAIGSGSHAEGWNTLASGPYSHAEGLLNTADKRSAHAEGEQNLASGIGSHAEGVSNTAQANYSHAEGSNCIAFGYYSHAGGIFTIASGSGQTVFGSYNKRLNTNSFFAIGNGTGESDEERGDIFRAESTGELVLSGGIRHHCSYSVGSVGDIVANKGSYLIVADTQTFGSTITVYLPKIDSDDDIGLTIKVRQHDINTSTTAVIISPNVLNPSYRISGFKFDTLALLVLNTNTPGGPDLSGDQAGRSVTLTYVGKIRGATETWLVTDTSKCATP